MYLREFVPEFQRRLSGHQGHEICGVDDETGDAYADGAYLVFFPGNTVDTDIFALAASNFWLLSAMSCFLDLSFAFGDLSPMVIASCSFSSGMLPPFMGKSKTIAAGSMSDSPVAAGARPARRRLARSQQ